MPCPSPSLKKESNHVDESTFLFPFLPNLKSARPRLFLSPRVCVAWGRGLLCLALCLVSHPVLAAAAAPARWPPLPNAAPPRRWPAVKPPGLALRVSLPLDAQGLVIMEPSQGTWRTLSTLALPGEKAQLVSQDGFVYAACGSQGTPSSMPVGLSTRPAGLGGARASGGAASLSANMLLARFRTGGLPCST